jgi:hypothetical protein
VARRQALCYRFAKRKRGRAHWSSGPDSRRRFDIVAARQLGTGVTKVNSVGPDRDGGGLRQRRAPSFSRERAQPLFWRQACLSVADLRGASTAISGVYSLSLGCVANLCLPGGFLSLRVNAARGAGSPPRRLQGPPRLPSNPAPAAQGPLAFRDQSEPSRDGERARPARDSRQRHAYLAAQVAFGTNICCRRQIGV